MRAVTWTQVAQYIVLIIAFVVPVVWLSVQQTGNPVPQVSYRYQLATVGAREQVLIADAGEQSVRAIFRQQVLDLEGKLAEPERRYACSVKRQRHWWHGSAPRVQK